MSYCWHLLRGESTESYFRRGVYEESERYIYYALIEDGQVVDIRAGGKFYGATAELSLLRRHTSDRYMKDFVSLWGPIENLLDSWSAKESDGWDDLFELI